MEAWNLHTPALLAVCQGSHPSRPPHDGGGDVFVGAKCAALGIFRWRRTLLSVVCEAGALQSSLKMRLRQRVRTSSSLLCWRRLCDHEAVHFMLLWCGVAAHCDIALLGSQA